MNNGELSSPSFPPPARRGRKPIDRRQVRNASLNLGSRGCLNILVSPLRCCRRFTAITFDQKHSRSSRPKTDRSSRNSPRSARATSPRKHAAGRRTGSVGCAHLRSVTTRQSTAPVRPSTRHPTPQLPDQCRALGAVDKPLRRGRSSRGR